jgi:hypothetical protein
MIVYKNTTVVSEPLQWEIILYTLRLDGDLLIYFHTCNDVTNETETSTVLVEKVCIFYIFTIHVKIYADVCKIIFVLS